MKRYIKESDLRAITSGSFEEKRRSFMEAIDAFENMIDKLSKHRIESKRPLALVATFEQHAVVTDADGDFYRYSLVNGKVAMKTPYIGFKTMSEAEMRRDSASLVEDAAVDILAGKDATGLIVKMIRM